VTDNAAGLLPAGKGDPEIVVSAPVVELMV